MATNEIKKGDVSAIGHTLNIIFFSVFVVFAVLLQCADIQLFGEIPDITFALICAIGFVAGERYGGIFGLIGGVLLAALGGGGISLSPILFTFCGYLCGAMPRVMLRRNFLSFLIYTPIMGAIHLLFTLIYYVMLSGSYDIWSVFAKRIIPEFFSCVIFMITAYGAVRLIYQLFKGKKTGSRAK